MVHQPWPEASYINVNIQKNNDRFWGVAACLRELGPKRGRVPKLAAAAFWNADPRVRISPGQPIFGFSLTRGSAFAPGVVTATWEVTGVLARRGVSDPGSMATVPWAEPPEARRWRRKFWAQKWPFPKKSSPPLTRTHREEALSSRSIGRSWSDRSTYEDRR